MIKYRQITDISLVTDISKNRYVKRRYDTIPLISISAIYHNIFLYIDPPLLESKDYKYSMTAICCVCVKVKDGYGKQF